MKLTKVRLLPLLGVVMIIATACSGTESYNTGTVVSPDAFTEEAAREILSSAVFQVCQESHLGITAELTSALRTAEAAAARQEVGRWVFSSSGDTARATPDGLVEGKLLKRLTTDC